jgi:hypothetical protein
MSARHSLSASQLLILFVVGLLFTLIVISPFQEVLCWNRVVVNSAIRECRQYYDCPDFVPPLFWQNYKGLTTQSALHYLLAKDVTYRRLICQDLGYAYSSFFYFRDRSPDGNYGYVFINTTTNACYIGISGRYVPRPTGFLEIYGYPVDLSLPLTQDLSNTTLADHTDTDYVLNKLCSSIGYRYAGTLDRSGLHWLTLLLILAGGVVICGCIFKVCKGKKRLKNQ